MKISLRSLLFLMLVVMLVSGFRNPQSGQTLRIASGAAGGVWNPLGKELQRVLSEALPGTTISVQETSGGIENLKLLTTGKADIAFTYDYEVAYINKGTLPAASSASENVRILAGLYEHPLAIITRAGTMINSPKDMAGKRVSTGIPGSGTEEQSIFVLDALGINPDTGLIRQKLGAPESADALKAGTIDAFFWSGALPTPAITTLASNTGIQLTFLPVSGELTDKLMLKHPGTFHHTSIPAGAYPGIKTDVETLGINAVLAVKDTFPRDEALTILETIFKRRAELAAVWGGSPDFLHKTSEILLAGEFSPYIVPTAADFIRGRETLYQVSTMNSLTTGHYDGLETVSWLKQHGDLGIGTFDGLEGEMIVVDGNIYQAIGTDKVVQPPDTITTPFADITWFDPEIARSLGTVPTEAALQEALLGMMPHKDSFYAIRVDATFKNIKIRTVPKQSKPYIPLAEVVKKQLVGERQNVSGTIVGFWSPDYVGGVNAPAWNLHFISADRGFAGHVMECSLEDAKAALDETRTYEVKLGPAGE